MLRKRSNRKRSNRKQRGGANKQKITFTFSVDLIGDGGASATDYPKMILAWYQDTITWSSPDFEDISVLYNASTGFYEGECYAEMDMNTKDIELLIEMLVDPDNNGNYPVVINASTRNSASYIQAYGDENIANNNYDRKDVYLIAGKIQSIKITPVESNIAVGEMRRIASNATNAITYNTIKEGNRMVNFNNEFKQGRYYKKNTYNNLVTVSGKKLNPFTRKQINAPEHYVATFTGGRKRKTKRRNRSRRNRSRKTRSK
jgi:hypothetical protein